MQSIFTKSPTPGKILCLHGFAQNASVFAKKSSGLRKALTKLGYQPVYLDAPIVLTPADLPFEPTPDPDHDFRSWWPANDTQPDYYRLDAAFDAVTRCAAEHGPFAGVIGFSQGAALAAILAGAGAPAFAVFYSGFFPLPRGHEFTGVTGVPTLHVVGSLDTVVSEERSEGLFEVCTGAMRERLRHAGGHYVPNAKAMVEPVIDFIERAGKGKEEPAKEEKEEAEDWAMFDKIGKS